MKKLKEVIEKMPITVKNKQGGKQVNKNKILTMETKNWMLLTEGKSGE